MYSNAAIPSSYPKISNRARRRLADDTIKTAQAATAILLGCLAQRGGEIIVTQGTLDQIGPKLADLDFVVEDGDNPGETRVRLVGA